MEKKIFQYAKAVWGTEQQKKYNQFLGFYVQVKGKEQEEITVSIAARSHYRLWVNGKIQACGPARTAKGYCRVDEIKLFCDSECMHIAVEVAAFNKPEKYCNDITLEPGMLTAEVLDQKGQMLAATGYKDSGFWYKELNSRRSSVETMSHSRGIIEWYDLTEESYAWIWGKGHWKKPVIQTEEPKYLIRRAPYALLECISAGNLMGIHDMVFREGRKPGFLHTLALSFNPKWYAMIPKENKILEYVRGLTEVSFSGRFEIKEPNSANRKIYLTPGKNDMAVTFSRRTSELGFVRLKIRVSEECWIDMINTDHLSYEGKLLANTYVTRYHLAAGRYELTTFEPKLVRFLRLIIHTKGDVELEYPQILCDSFPDTNLCDFTCDDGDINRIYDGARRTLRLSTLDIFMDCPQRERAGWLCDSAFSAAAAWQIFGDLRTEKDFLENFLLTDGIWKDFFPEVYPSSRENSEDAGFINWSYWLMIQLADYYKRSGDIDFIEKHRSRVQRFVTGLLSLRGEGGLIESRKNEFVDWSLSNREFSIKPVSIPNNCLAIKMLRELGGMYDRSEWIEIADQMDRIIRKMDASPGLFGGGGDGAEFQDSQWRRTDCPTEGGQALEIWCGFHREDKEYVEKFVKTMGPCPQYRANPNIGKANLFIGLMIRFCTLAELGYMDVLLKELKNVYLEELKLGSGTFFENINALSGCHGFNGMTAALLANHILGLGQPEGKNKTIRIAPHPGELRWAQGTACCQDGLIFCSWRANQDSHILELQTMVPEGWKVEFYRDFSLIGWKIIWNGEEYRDI